jgi:hypothetical protein
MNPVIVIAKNAIILGSALLALFEPVVEVLLASTSDARGNLDDRW